MWRADTRFAPTMPLSPQEKDNLTRWHESQKGFYEVYYLKWNDVANGRAVWLRYTLLSPKNRPPEASVWAIIFDTKDPSNNFGLKKDYPLSEARIERDFFYFAAGPSAIFQSGARGELDDGKNQVSWEIKFGDPLLSLRHFPSSFYWGGLPKTKLLAPYLSTKLSGEITINGRRIDFENLPAHQAHIWGTDMAPFWTWANCNAFTGPDEFCFEGLSARLNVGGRTTPPLTLLFFQWEGRFYRFATPWDWWRNKSQSSLDRWIFEATDGNILFSGELTARLPEIAGVKYENPDGSLRYCHNTKTGDLKIRVLRKKKFGWEEMTTYEASGTAAFETVQPTLDPRARLLIP